MKQFRVIGDPVAHSLSPVIYNTLGEFYGIELSYTALPVKDIDLFFRDTAPALYGFNITMPWKNAVIPYLKTLTPAACLTQSVNTVRMADLAGTSTDGTGLSLALQRAEFDNSGNIVILGAGAVTRSIALTLGQKAKSITFVNRTREKAEAAAKFVCEHTPAKGFVCDTVPPCDLFINATPLGMSGCKEFASFSFLDALSPSTPVCDLIYSPPETKLLSYAKKRGHRILNGLPMLIFQALAAFEFYFDIAPEEKAFLAVKKALLPHG